MIFGTDIKQNGSVMTNVYGVTAYSSNSIKMNCDIVLKVCTPYMCDSGEAERVVHHEMFHYIENVLSLKNSSKYSDWTEWVSLNNPQGFEYNDQINIGQGETQKLKTSSLISWYAGYSASEDRAEVFSYMCMDTGLPSTTRIKAASYDPYLKKKASYLAAEVNSALGLSNTVWSAGATAMNEAALPTDGLQSATVIATGGIKLRESTIRNNVYVQNSGSDVEIPAGATVTIYRWSNEIVQIGYNGHVGYCDTEDLQRINSNPLLLSSSFHASLICGAVIHHYNKKRKLVA